MKFGKAFVQQFADTSAWRSHAIAYKQLKQLLKSCVGVSRHQKLNADTFARCTAHGDPQSRTDAALRTSQTEAAFFRALRNEIDKVNRFFVAQQISCGNRIRAFESELLEDVRVATSGATQNSSRVDTWMQRCDREYANLLALEQFCVMNFCAVTKILKKHDKWTGYSTRTRFERGVLVKQPFATYVPLLQMMQRVQAVAVRLSVLSLSSSSGLSSDAASLLALASGLPQPQAALPTSQRVAHNNEEEDGYEDDDDDDYEDDDDDEEGTDGEDDSPRGSVPNPRHPLPWRIRHGEASSTATIKRRRRQTEVAS